MGYEEHTRVIFRRFSAGELQILTPIQITWKPAKIKLLEKPGCMVKVPGLRAQTHHIQCRLQHHRCKWDPPPSICLQPAIHGGPWCGSKSAIDKMLSQYMSQRSVRQSKQFSSDLVDRACLFRPQFIGTSWVVHQTLECLYSRGMARHLLSRKTFDRRQ